MPRLSSFLPKAMLPAVISPRVQFSPCAKSSWKISSPKRGRVSTVAVIPSVAAGKGVNVAVGGNQTIVAVGVWLGDGGVKLGRGGGRVAVGKHAGRASRQNTVRPAHSIQRMRLVYYGKTYVRRFLAECLSVTIGLPMED